MRYNRIVKFLHDKNKLSCSRFKVKLNNFDIAVNWIDFVLGPNTGSRGLTKNIGV